MTDIRTILHRAARELAAAGSPSPRLDAEVLLMRFLGMDRLQLCMHPERELSQEEAAGFARWVERRSLGEPVAYILGEKEFWSLPLRGRTRGSDPETGDGMPHRGGPAVLPSPRGGAAGSSISGPGAARSASSWPGNCPRPGWSQRTSRRGRSRSPAGTPWLTVWPAAWIFLRGISLRRFPGIGTSSVPIRPIFRRISTISCRKESGISNPGRRSSPVRTMWPFTGKSSGKGRFA